MSNKQDSSVWTATYSRGFINKRLVFDEVYSKYGVEVERQNGKGKLKG